MGNLSFWGKYMIFWMKVSDPVKYTIIEFWNHTILSLKIYDYQLHVSTIVYFTLLWSCSFSFITCKSSLLRIIDFQLKDFLFYEDDRLIFANDRIVSVNIVYFQPGSYFPDHTFHDRTFHIVFVILVVKK